MSKQPLGRRVTLQDIALRTGYTVNTVSRALKNMTDISQATREYIQGIADEMGYIRNQMASSLRSGSTKTLGVVVGGMSNPYYGIMTDTIQDLASSLGYSLLILCSRDKAELEMQVTEAALSRQVDGLLLFPCDGSGNTIERLKKLGIPFVLMARHLQKGQADSVVCDEEQGAYLATRHLIESGRRKIGFMSSFQVIYSSEQRRLGFLRACDEAGLKQEDRRIALCRDDESILSCLLEWKNAGIDGIFFFCDIEAWGAVSLLSAHHIAVPRDIAIVGFDNIQGYLRLHFPLCSVEYGLSEMAARGVDLLMRRIHGESSPPQTIIVSPKLICRGSCRQTAANER